MRELFGASAIDLALIERGGHLWMQLLEQRFLESVGQAGNPNRNAFGGSRDSAADGLQQANPAAQNQQNYGR
jgi:hypothetical protein